MRFFIFLCVDNVEARIKANTQNVQQGEQETREAGGEGQNSGEQRHEEICGRERDGARLHRVNKMDTSGTFRSLHDRDFHEGKQGI